MDSYRKIDINKQMNKNVLYMILSRKFYDVFLKSF